MNAKAVYDELARTDPRQVSLFGSEHTQEILAHYHKFWIAVDDFYPADGEKVWGFIDGKIEEVVCVSKKIGEDEWDEYFTYPNGGYIDGKVTHWKSLED